MAEEGPSGRLAGSAAGSIRAYRSHTVRVLEHTGGIVWGFALEVTSGDLESDRRGALAAWQAEADAVVAVVAEDVVEEAAAVQATIHLTIRTGVHMTAAAEDLVVAYT